MKLLRKLFPYLIGLSLVLTLAAPTLLLAQTPAPPVPPDVGEIGAGIIPHLVSVVLIPFLVYGVRLVAPRLPRVSIPLIVFGLASAADYLITLVQGGGYSPVVAASVTGLSVLLREVVNTLREHGLG